MSDIMTFINQETAVRSSARDQNREAPVAPAAWRLYRSTFARGWFRQQWARLIGRSQSLLDLSVVEAQHSVRVRHTVGLQTVPIAQIRGSENRCTDFDAEFHPLQRHTEERWLSVATALHRDVTLPPIQVIQIGDTFFVRDGHHRVSVMRARGQTYIEAYVTLWQIDASLPWDD